jgi:hypothetical protein
MPIRVREEDLLPMVASLGDVMHDVRDHNSSFSRHLNRSWSAGFAVLSRNCPTWRVCRKEISVKSISAYEG